MARTIEAIAHIHTLFSEKFGIPRQSNLAETQGEIIFVPKYRNPDAVRGIEEFSYLWLLWDFSKARQGGFEPLVAPPRLGGKEKRGVFATRSPRRPNSIGLSSVRLTDVRMDGQLGPVLTVWGADMLDGTPIYDIKPYLPYTDSHADASGGFGEKHSMDEIAVEFPEKLLKQLPEDYRNVVFALLRQDPRAAYNKQPGHVYGMAFGEYDIGFEVRDEVLRVQSVRPRGEDNFCKVKGT